jgi:hypothetical protein
VVLLGCIFRITMIGTTKSKLLVPPEECQVRTDQTELRTTPGRARSVSGMNTTTSGNFSSSISREIQKKSRFPIILGNRVFFWISRGGGHSMVPLPLVFMSRDTWTTPETTLAWWCDSSSAATIAMTRSFKNSHSIISDPSLGKQCRDMSRSTAPVLQTDRVLLVLKRLV